MIYTIETSINCFEQVQSFSICPKELHSHKLWISVTLNISDLVDEQELVANVKDSISDSVFLQEKWTLNYVTQQIFKEVKSLLPQLKKIKVTLWELNLSCEVEDE